ncbi:MAG: DUF2268 domain-containing putative Zn-dependent protease [bacterium]
MISDPLETLSWLGWRKVSGFLILFLAMAILLGACAPGSAPPSPDQSISPESAAPPPTSTSSLTASVTEPMVPFSIPLADGRRLINLVEAFLSYADEGRDRSEEERTSLWLTRLESLDPSFFNEVLYRKLEGAERDLFRQSLIEQFWNEIVPNVETLRQVNREAPQLIQDGRSAFQQQFPRFDPQTDYYLTVSFSFNGKVVDLQGRNTLAIGLEKFTPGSPELPMTIAHEQFHLYHLAGFSIQGALYRSVWEEGLATYVSALVVPGYRLSQYLGFSVDRMNEIADRFSELCGRLAGEMSSTDPSMKRAFLGVEENDLGIPPACGYYLGFILVQRLTEQYSLEELASWDADRVYREMQNALPLLQL